MIYDGIITKPPIEQLLMHSGVKGMEWKDHKYIKKANGDYYYTEGSGGGSSSGGSTYGEYKKGDSDFDEKNYSEKNRLGDTDFYGFTKPDGSVVILEEDMKWTLPKGTKLTPELTKRLEDFNKDIEARRNKGEKITGAEWNKLAKQAIDSRSSSSPSGDGKLSDKDLDNLSDMVIRGEFKNGNERKELLSEYYQDIQKLVNQKLGKKSKSKTKDSDSSTKKSDNPDYEIKEGPNHYKYKVRKKK